MSEKKKYQPRYSSLENSNGASVNSNASPNATSNTTSDTESINNNQSTKPAGMSFETFIGKNAMAIGASLLIFISMVMFAVVIIPILGDVIKIAAMFLLSFAFIVLGELHAKKKGANKWNTSLVGCGVGGIFVSLFVTYIYFHAIDIIVLYVLLIIWSCFTCFLGKSKSIAFTIIGQLGIVISSAFSATQIYALEDFLAVVAMIILAEASFFATDFFAKSYWNSFSTWLGTALSFVSVFNTYLDEYPFDYIYALAIDLVLVGLAIIIIWYASLIQGRYVDTEGKNNAFQIQLTVTVFPISLLILYFLDGELEYIGLRDIANIIYILLSLAAIYAMDKFQLKTVKDKTLKQVLQVLIAIVSYIAVFNVLSSYFDLGIAIGGGITITMQLMSLIYGKIKKNIFAKAYSLGLILVMVSADFYSEELQLFFVAIMFMAALIERILEKPEERNIVYDSIVYPFGFLLLTDIIYKGCNLFDVMPLYRTVGTYIVLTLLQILAYVVGLARIRKPNGKSYNVM
ncbi:MAG: hypothetical protein IJ675_03240, partial [Pseudobutyrivibrio sp.]|nr:hypothetical protein [Pseudobutyrivibrio sp.]